MHEVEQPLTGAVVEDFPEQLEFCVVVAQSVTMRQEEYLSVDLCRDGLLVDDESTLVVQVAIGPQVVVACEEVDLHAHVGQFRELAEETGVAFGHHIPVFVPEVEHVAQEIYGGGLVLYRVEETHQPALLRAAVLNGPRAQVGIGKKIYILHKSSQSKPNSVRASSLIML